MVGILFQSLKSVRILVFRKVLPISLEKLAKMLTFCLESWLEKTRTITVTANYKQMTTQDLLLNDSILHTPAATLTPHSSTLAWKIPWMEEPGGLQSMGSLRVGHD